MNENECMMNEEEGIKILIKMNEGLNVVDESQLGDKWKIELIEQWMKKNVWWIKKRESIFWLRNECGCWMLVRWQVKN